jgi:hypothetical protein
VVSVVKVDRIIVLGLLAIVLFGAFLAFLDLKYAFPVFSYAGAPSNLVKIDLPTLGQSVGTFLWSYRVFDLIALALVLFGAAACCMAMIREEKEEEIRSP